MAHASKTVTINRPQKQIFDFLADGLNNPKWRSAVTDISLTEGSPNQVGAVYKQGVRGPMGRRLDADYKIVEFNPDSIIAFLVIKGPARPTGRFTFFDSGGGIEVTFTLDFQPKGWARLLGPMIQKTMEAEVQTLEDLKNYLENNI
jgi:uncharacterized membrane protein